MQCIHIVKIEPIFDEEKSIESIRPHHIWLKENGITRFRGGRFPKLEELYRGYISFRFACVEDATAFKLRWL